VVQEMLGHSDIRVTRGYTHVSSLLAQDAAARVGRALFGGLLPKLIPRAMIHKASRAFPQVRWSRLSESNHDLFITRVSSTIERAREIHGDQS